MKRRDFTMKLACGLMVSQFIGCSSLGFSTGSSGPAQQKDSRPTKPAQKTTGGTSGRRTQSGITDLKTLSKLLEQARRPLTDDQVEYLLKLKPGPEFAEKMMDILTDAQKEAIINASKRRRR